MMMKEGTMKKQIALLLSFLLTIALVQAAGAVESGTAAPAAGAAESGTDVTAAGHSYRLVVSDCSWTQAFQNAKAAGGRLATFETEEEYQAIIDQITQAGLSYINFRIGGRRDPAQKQYFWVDSENRFTGSILNATSSWAYSAWLAGEPSFQDGTVQESFMDMFYYQKENRWVLNDVPDDIVSLFSIYSGKLGYIIEFDGTPSATPAPVAAPGVTVAPSTLLTAVPESFYFSSGAGAWGTEITLNDDGTFTGSYHDSNMGEDTENYPGGTVYCCNFSGSFTDFRQVDDYTWSMRLASLDYENAVGDNWAENGIHYIASDAYGISGGDLFYLYLKGHPTDTLPEEYMSWARMYMGFAEVPALTIYGIYNAAQEQGWGSSAY